VFLHGFNVLHVVNSSSIFYIFFVEVANNFLILFQFGRCMEIVFFIEVASDFLFFLVAAWEKSRAKNSKRA